MFLRDAGIFVPFFFAENAKPCATPGVGYGSCPNMTTFMEDMGEVNARKILSKSGATFFLSKELSIESICG
jgi:hypothetical protein